MRIRLVAAALVLSAGAALAAPLPIKVASATVEGGMTGPVLSLKLDEASTKSFADLTAANIGKVVELRIDGKVVMAPVVRDPITTGQVEVSGDFQADQLNEIALRLNDGTATVEVEPRDN